MAKLGAPTYHARELGPLRQCPAGQVREGHRLDLLRENTEGEYVLGSSGFNVTEDLAVDFKVITSQGAERIVHLAFEYAKKNGINRVSAVTKANVIKTTDGKFWSRSEGGGGVPGHPVRRLVRGYNGGKAGRREAEARLQGDRPAQPVWGHTHDEAAEFQAEWAPPEAPISAEVCQFEAIHGSAPRMVDEGRAQYADRRA